MIDFGDLDQLYGQPEVASSDAALGGTADGMGTPYGGEQPEPLGDIAAPAPDAISDGDPSVRFGYDSGPKIYEGMGGTVYRSDDNGWTYRKIN
jgi:hypothetical protein